MLALPKSFTPDRSSQAKLPYVRATRLQIIYFRPGQTKNSSDFLPRESIDPIQEFGRACRERGGVARSLIIQWAVWVKYWFAMAPSHCGAKSKVEVDEPEGELATLVCADQKVSS